MAAGTSGKIKIKIKIKIKRRERESFVWCLSLPLPFISPQPSAFMISRSEYDMHLAILPRFLFRPAVLIVAVFAIALMASFLAETPVLHPAAAPSEPATEPVRSTLFPQDNQSMLIQPVHALCKIYAHMTIMNGRSSSR
jgi:hypothetical protein